MSKGAAALEAELDLAALGVMTQDEARDNAFARILLLGPAKAGKTTAIAGTAPLPLVINCDGQSATKGARNVHPEQRFNVIEATSRSTLKHALSVAEKLVAAGAAKTIVLDTITLLADNLLDECSVTLDGYDLWNEMADQLVGCVKRLSKLEAHLFVIAHMKPDSDPAAGIMPAIPGQSKVRIPAMLDDWILLDVNPEATPERAFLLGPQKSWTHSGRNVRRTCAVPANVPALFEELGLAL